MRCFLLYTLFFSAHAPFFCQSDSALYQLRHIGNDTEQVNRIYKDGFAIRHTDPELAYRYAEAAEEAALTCHSRVHLAKAYNLKGVLHYKKGDYSRALSYQTKALALNEQAGSIYGMAVNHTNLGNIYSEIGYDVPAENAYLKALKAYNALNNRQQIVNSLINLGVLKDQGKHYGLALRYFQTALAMATEDHDLAVMASCNNNIGAVLMEENLADSALFYLEESLKLLDLQENVMEMADVYNNMGMSYIKKNMLPLANYHLEKAARISSAYNYTDARLHVYESFALLYERQKNFEEANTWLKKHYALKDSIWQLSRNAMALSFSDGPANRVQTDVPQSQQLPVLKNGWLLVILGAFLIGIPLLLIRYKR